jgi:hypothetical protein
LLSLFAKLTRHSIAERHSGEEGGFSIPKIVRVFVLEHLRSQPDVLGEIFSLTWNMVIHRTKQSLNMNLQAHIQSLLEIRKLYALPGRFTDEHIDNICFLSAWMMDVGFAGLARRMLDLTLEDIELSPSNTVLFSRLELAHARALDGAQITDRQQALTERRQAIRNLLVALSQADCGSQVSITEQISSGLFDLVESLLEFEGIDAANEALKQGFILLQSLGNDKITPGGFATYHHRYAMIAAHCGNLEESLQYIQKASQTASAASLVTLDYDIYYAIILIRQERWLEASKSLMETWEKVVCSSGPFNDYCAKVLLPLGVSLLFQGRLTPAM